MNRIIISIYLIINIIYGINPPQNGNFPDGFWEKMSQQDIGLNYGDPGWINKINNQINDPSRDTQLEFYIPVLLGKYADASNTYFNASDFQNLLFGADNSGSMKEYYNEISYGNFQVDGSTGGWYQSSLTMSQAVENTRQYVAEIAAQADPDFDYAQYDNDGPDNVPNSGDDDGYVDGIIVVYSGCGAEWGEGNNNLWPHMSSLSSYEYETNDLGANGSNIIVSSYAVSPELAGGGDCYTDIIRPMGVYAHEFGHILGLPDLYDRDASNGNSEGLGEWCLMASGSWMGWGGDTPAHMSSWCKIQMGWIEPTVVVNNADNVEIAQLASSPSTLKIWEDDYNWSRYFLIENRQAVGFDSELHGPGLLVYHVDENRRYGPNAWSSGPVNDNEENKLVDLEEADGDNDLDNENNRGDNGDPFPGTLGNRTFDDNSNPSSSRNDGSATGISLTNISDPGSIMTVDIETRPQYGYAIAYDENGIANQTVNMGFEDSWSGVLFTAEESGYITEIDFGVVNSYFWYDGVMDYVVYVYDSFDGNSPGNLMDSVSGSTEISNWITVAIDSVAVASGQDFFVSIKFINEPMAFCYDNTGPFSGRSYLSSDGINFDNMLSDYGDANIRAKISTNVSIEIEPVTKTVVNINNMAYWVNEDGAGTNQGSPNGQQADYPIFTGGIIYEDGLLWGVKSNEYVADRPVRVGGSTYYKGMKAGNVRYDAAGNVIGSDDPANHHAWRVRTDWSTADLTIDASNFYGYTSPFAASATEVQNVKDQYEYDWNNWPADLGAPYDDVDNNGVYDPSVDVPGYPGADQTVWTISNDVPTIVDADGNFLAYSNTSESLYGSDPVGVELQVTVWAYKLESDMPLGNAIYKKAKLTYTGLEAGSQYINPEVLDSVYFTQWSDPDLGTYTDDYVGCDIDLSLGFVYNGNETDGVFNGTYGMPAPAGGYDFLKSPEDGNGIELGMTAFTYFGANASISDPDLGSYNGSLQFFNLMEGFLPRPEYPTQIPFTNPITDEETKFALPGDPATGQGWIDGIELPAGDRRLVMSSGPFSMNKGESQEIIVALLGAQRINPIESLRELKKDDESIQLAYDTDFNLLDYSVNTNVSADQNTYTVSLSVNVSEAVTTVDATLDNGSGSEVDLVLDLSNNYSIQTELAESPNPYMLSLVVNLSSGVSYSLDSLAQKAIIWDPTIISDYQVVYDNLSDDGELNIGDMAQIALTITNSSDHEIEELVGMVLNVDGPINYLNDPYLSFDNIAPNGSASSSVSVDDKGYFTIEVSESAQEGDTLVLALRFFDLLGNIWEDEYELYIQGIEGITDFIEPEHINGSADGNFAYRVVRPDDVTGHEYELFFSIYDWGTGRDLSGSNLSGIGYRISGDPSITLEFQVNIVSPDYNYADGVRLIFPDDVEILGANEGFSSVVSMVSGNEVMFGDSSLSTGGFFSGGQILYVYVDTSSQVPINIDYVIYDDGWSQAWCIDNCETCESYEIGFDCDGEVLSEVINAQGSIEITGIVEHEFSDAALLLNVKDVTLNEIVLTTEDLPDENGFNIDIIDGFKLFKGSVIYGSAKDVNEIIYEYDLPCWDPANRPCFQEEVDGNYNINSYLPWDWAVTAKAVDTWGAGITSPAKLGRDVQIRFTGVYGAPVPMSNGGVYVPVNSGGSMAWYEGARYGDAAAHPENPNPGSTDPFRIRIPFEVWDMEHPNGPRQIDILIYDRIQVYDGSVDTVWAFNPYNRMYTHFILEDHATSDAAATFSEDSLTWNVVWWTTDWVNGDEITFEYLTPISTEDRYLFTPATGTFRHISDVIPDGYNLVQNYPNPFNPTTKIDYGLPEVSNVKLVIYDILGREVTTLVNGVQDAGYKSITWHGTDAFGKNVGAGMYFYHLKAGDFRQVKKMVLLK